jgi:hypothetical protein
MLVASALLLMVVPAYAQWQLPHFTKGTSKLWLVRLLLIVVGAAAGYAIVGQTLRPGIDAVALFLIGFALVHAPAAIVLFLKHLRDESKS